MGSGIAVAQWVVLDAACGGSGKALTRVNPPLPQERPPPSKPQIPSQGFNLCSIFAHSPVSGHQPATSNWMFWAKMGRKVERVKRKNPNPKAMDPAGIHPATGGALAASQRSGWNGPSLAWRRFNHHFLGCRIGWFPGKRWEL